MDENNEFGEFDDWYNDGENCGEELQNQAATLDKATSEERTLRDDENIIDAQTQWGGELYVRFVKADGKTSIKKCSGHIIKQAADDSFVAITARTNLHYKQPENAGVLDAQEGYFFLQRIGENSMAQFRFGSGDISHYTGAEWDHDADHIQSAMNLSCIKLTEVKKRDDMLDATALPPIGALDVDEIDTEKYTLSGYPAIHIQGGGQVPCLNTMYSGTGEIKYKPGPLYGIDFLTSKGQNGGALTNEVGQVAGVYTGIGNDPNDSTKQMGFVTAINETVEKWLNAAFDQ